MTKLALVLLIMALVHPARSQQADMEHTPFQIGEINYFGYGGIDLVPIRSQLPLHVGDTLTFATFSKGPTEATITHLTGQPPTDLNITCCDEAKHLLIYIGLGGTSSRPMPTGISPHGTDHLDPAALHLYDQEMTALERAVVSGNAGEDDSKGNMLSNDPALHQINLSMHTYAATREAEFIRVLRMASDPHQRRAAAAFLGYVPRSTTQVKALTQAVNDPDDEVRNNAVRALSVLLAARKAQPLLIDPQPFIAMLFSGKWTDRNKGSLLLFRLTESRNPTLLDALRRQALQPLIEGASWSGDPGHSTAFLVILGRIAGIPNDRLQQLIDAHNSAAIIAAASKPLGS